MLIEFKYDKDCENVLTTWLILSLIGIIENKYLKSHFFARNKIFSFSNIQTESECWWHEILLFEASLFSKTVFTNVGSNLRSILWWFWKRSVHVCVSLFIGFWANLFMRCYDHGNLSLTQNFVYHSYRCQKIQMTTRSIEL